MVALGPPVSGLEVAGSAVSAPRGDPAAGSSGSPGGPLTRPGASLSAPGGGALDIAPTWEKGHHAALLD